MEGLRVSGEIAAAGWAEGAGAGAAGFGLGAGWFEWFLGYLGSRSLRNAE